MSKRILIAGCGRIGTRLGVQLAEESMTVYGLRRSTHPLPPAISPIRANLSVDEDLADKLPSAIDCVYIILTPDQYDDNGYKRSYVEGTARLIEALGATGNAHCRVIFVSSTGVYGQSQGQWVDEDSPTEPTRFSGQRLLEAEAIAATHPGESVAVRFGGIYGPGREALLRRVRQGGTCQSDPPLYTNRIHEDDCIDILDHLGAIPNPEAIYIGVDSAPVSQCEVMDWLAAELNLPAVERKAGNAESSGKRCSNRRLLASGYALKFADYRAGYSALLSDPR